MKFEGTDHSFVLSCRVMSCRLLLSCHVLSCFEATLFCRRDTMDTDEEKVGGEEHAIEVDYDDELRCFRVVKVL